VPVYGWIWRNLPGPLPVRVLAALALAAVMIAVLFTAVFPWAERTLPFLDVTVQDAETVEGGEAP
jgi:hypothetical protein